FVVKGKLLDQRGPQFRVIVDYQDLAGVGHRRPNLEPRRVRIMARSRLWMKRAPHDPPGADHADRWSRRGSDSRHGSLAPSEVEHPETKEQAPCLPSAEPNSAPLRSGPSRAGAAAAFSSPAR